METLVKVSPKEVVADIYAAFSRGDLPTILSHLSSNVNWEAMGQSSNIPYGGKFKGANQVPNFFAALAESFQMTDFKVDEIYQNGNVVTAYGLHKGKGIKSGIPSETIWAMRWEFNNDGQIVKYNNYFDTGAIGKSF